VVHAYNDVPQKMHFRDLFMEIARKMNVKLSFTKNYITAKPRDSKDKDKGKTTFCRAVLFLFSNDSRFNVSFLIEFIGRTPFACSRWNSRLNERWDTRLRPSSTPGPAKLIFL